jgi:hypothetical protein
MASWESEFVRAATHRLSDIVDTYDDGKRVILVVLDEFRKQCEKRPGSVPIQLALNSLTEIIDGRD